MGLWTNFIDSSEVTEAGRLTCFTILRRDIQQESFEALASLQCCHHLHDVFMPGVIFRYPAVPRGLAHLADSICRPFLFRTRAQNDINSNSVWGRQIHAMPDSIRVDVARSLFHRRGGNSVVSARTLHQQ